MTQMTTTRIRLPKYALVVLFLLPAALVIPWIFVLLMPALLVGAAFHFGWFGLSRAWKEDGPEGPVDVLMVRGLESAPEVERGLRQDLDELFEATEASEDPVACACVKQMGNEYVGILRTRTRGGYTFARRAASTPQHAGVQLRRVVQGYTESFPETTPEADPHHDCDSARCPLGRKSVFYVHRDEVGRPRMRMPRG